MSVQLHWYPSTKLLSADTCPNNFWHGILIFILQLPLVMFCLNTNFKTHSLGSMMTAHPSFSPLLSSLVCIHSTPNLISLPVIQWFICSLREGHLISLLNCCYKLLHKSPGIAGWGCQQLSTRATENSSAMPVFLWNSYFIYYGVISSVLQCCPKCHLRYCCTTNNFLLLSSSHDLIWATSRKYS